MGDGAHTPYEQRTLCSCDWTFHRGRPCLNPLPNRSVTIPGEQLCLACLYSCQVEREEARTPPEAS